MATSYTGRVGAIVTQCGRDMNDTNLVNPTEADYLSWINQALYDLGQLGYFSKVGTIDSVAGQESYSLTTLLTDFGVLRGVFLAETGRPLIAANSWEDFEESRASGYSGTPGLYSVLGTTIYFFPTPSSSATGAFRVLYGYPVTAMTGATPTDTPPTPTLFDNYFIAYCKWKAFQIREADTYARTNLKAPEYYQEMMQIRGRLMNSTAVKPRLKPYRP